MITLLTTAMLASLTYNLPANFCANPRDGTDVRLCMGMLLTAETERMTEYLAAARVTLDGRPSLSGEDPALALTQSQIQWETYADAACGVIGDATDFLEQDCMLELTQQRTHHLWEYFLVGFDGGALLEEPEPLMVDAADE